MPIMHKKCAKGVVALETKGTFHLLELASWTMTGPVILTMKLAFSNCFAEEPSPSCTLFRI